MTNCCGSPTPSWWSFEMDCGWVVAAGRNPVDYLIKTPERFPLLHVKDMVQGANGEYHSTVMGKGVVDYPDSARGQGAQALLHRAGGFDMDPIEAIRLDAEYMHKLKL
jgi:hypothetical protein